MKKNILLRGLLLARSRGFKYFLTQLLASFPPTRLIADFFLATLNSIFIRDLTALSAGIHTNQLWAERAESFESLIRTRVALPSVRVLEIGSWFGGGSTRIILKHLSKTGSFYSIDAYSAKGYLGSNSHVSNSAKRMARQTLSAWISSSIRLFKSQANFSEANIVQIRTESRELSNLLNPNFKFDLIYIDGSHIYSHVVEDLQFAMQFIKKGGVICGDDLDLGIDIKLIEIAKVNHDSDLVVLDNGQAFHPGVLLAVSEKFKSVDCSSGFWWVTV